MNTPWRPSSLRRPQSLASLVSYARPRPWRARYTWPLLGGGRLKANAPKVVTLGPEPEN